MRLERTLITDRCEVVDQKGHALTLQEFTTYEYETIAGSKAGVPTRTE